MSQKIQENSASADAMIRAFDNTNICIFMYYPQTKTIIVPEKTCLKYKCAPEYANMPHSFADEVVYQDDYAVFKEMYYKIDRGEKTASSKFHSKNLDFYWHVTLTTINVTKDGKPQEVFGIIENVTDSYKNSLLVQQIKNQLLKGGDEQEEVQEAMRLIATSIGGLYFALYHIWMEDCSYICFHEKASAYFVPVGEKRPYDQKVWENYIHQYVEEEYRKELIEFVNFSTLQQRLHDTDSIVTVYRRKEIGWTRAHYIVAKRNADGDVTNVIFTVSDINAEVQREKEQEQAIYETLHDPMTGVYNRKGFEQVVAESQKKGEPVGFAIIDVDHFKTLNDTYGHDVGDQVIRRVAYCLTETFRNEDSIFRLGGDEFGILLRGYGNEIWKSFCRKQEFIHRTLHEAFPKLKSITISVGLTFSKKGYNEEMFLLSDEALYETKHNGRSGCTLIDNNHVIRKRWRDEKNSLRTETALDRSAAGVYRMEFPFDSEEAPRMICNDMAKMILGVDNHVTPEECYQAWVKGIEPDYYEVLWETRHKMVTAHRAECTYLWNHPTWGQIYVRSGGFGETNDEMEVLYGYHHALKDTEIVERKDNSHKIVQALNDMFFASYFIHIKDYRFTILKEDEGIKKELSDCKDIRRAFQYFLNHIIGYEYVEKLRAFYNMDTIAERLKNHTHIDCEYRSKIADGWCQASFLPINYDEKGEVIDVIFVVSALDASRVKDIEESIVSKKSLKALFDNVPGGLVLYEWNGKAFKILRISDYYEKQYGDSLLSGKGVNKGGAYYNLIHPDDIEDCQRAIMEGINHTHHFEHVYRVWSQSLQKYEWVKMSAVVDAQQDGTALVYALYTDVTKQKETEQSLEKSQVSLAAALNASNQLSYEYDPVAHTGICYTDSNFFGLPKYIENYPDSLKDIDLFHKDDADLFIRTAHLMDHKNEQVTCDVRIKKAGQYGWYSCTFEPYFNSEKGRNVAILSVVDVSSRMATVHDYEERISSLLAANVESMRLCTVNFTKNTFEMVKVQDAMKPLTDNIDTLDAMLYCAAEVVVGEKEKEAYRKLFNRASLLKLAEEGTMHVQMEYLFRFSEHHYEWMIAIVDMVRNPITREVSGVCYSRSNQKEHMEKILLENTLYQDYLFAAMIFTDTDEYYLFDSRRGTYGECQKNYWDVVARAIQPLDTENELVDLQKKFTKGAVIEQLETKKEYAYAFDSSFNGTRRRLEIKYRYMDEQRTMILASMRNITDSLLLEKLRYDSEHDSLTNLYNRRTLF